MAGYTVLLVSVGKRWDWSYLHDLCADELEIEEKSGAPGGKASLSPLHSIKGGEMSSLQKVQIGHYRCAVLIAMVLSLILASVADAESPAAAICGDIAFPRGTGKRTPDQQIVWYRERQRLIPGTMVIRGKNVRQLPLSIHQISPHWSFKDQAMDVDRYMDAQRVSGVLVLKDGAVVLERYGFCRTADDRWHSQSVAKSVTSILVGAAIQDGYIKSLDAPVIDYIHELKGSAYDGVTIRQLLTMTSGVKWNEDWDDPNSDAMLEWSGGFVDGVDPTVAYMRRVSRADQPGTKFVYKTAETNLAGVLVSKAVGTSLSEYLSEKLWRPYGMEKDAFWETNSAHHNLGGYGLSITLRDYARIGQFMLEGGKVGEVQVLPPGWVADATSVRVTFPQKSEEAGVKRVPGFNEAGVGYVGYGYYWWILKNGYAALGTAGQAIFVYPQDRVVIAINSAQTQENEQARDTFVEAVRAAAVAQR